MILTIDILKDIKEQKVDINKLQEEINAKYNVVKCINGVNNYIFIEFVRLLNLQEENEIKLIIYNHKVSRSVGMELERIIDVDINNISFYEEEEIVFKDIDLKCDLYEIFFVIEKGDINCILEIDGEEFFNVSILENYISPFFKTFVKYEEKDDLIYYKIEMDRKVVNNNIKIKLKYISGKKDLIIFYFYLSFFI